MFRTKKNTPKITQAVRKEKKKTSCFMLVMAVRSSTTSSPAPKRAKRGVRHHLQLTLHSQATKEGFLSRRDQAKKQCYPGAVQWITTAC